MSDKEIFVVFYKKLLSCGLTQEELAYFNEERTKFFSKHHIDYIDKIMVESLLKVYGGQYYV
jgi:hypothetical protein